MINATEFRYTYDQVLAIERLLEEENGSISRVFFAVEYMMCDDPRKAVMLVNLIEEIKNIPLYRETHFPGEH